MTRSKMPRKRKTTAAVGDVVSVHARKLHPRKCVKDALGLAKTASIKFEGLRVTSIGPKVAKPPPSSSCTVLSCRAPLRRLHIFFRRYPLRRSSVRCGCVFFEGRPRTPGCIMNVIFCVP